MNAERVSVVIPCFNAARYIAAAIRSVLAQRWPDLEIIVVDDGSTDGSAELVAAAFPQVTLLRQPNRGAAEARNLGIRHACGSWIAFLDADDIWLPGKLHAQAKLVSQDASARMVYTAWQVWVSQDSEPSAAESESLVAGADDATRWSGPTGWIYPELLLECVLWTSTIVAHRSLFDEIGLFDAGLHVGEDYDLWLRASRVTPILRVPRPYALYRMHPASITHAPPRENYRSIVVSRALARWGYGHDRAGAMAPSRVRRALAQSWSEFAAANLSAGEFDRAGRAAWMSLRADPTHAAAWKVLLRTAIGALSPHPALNR
jgi:glycosyltransferase involved in cell wall biosynthesis